MFDFKKALRLVDETGYRREKAAELIGMKRSTLNLVLCGAMTPSLKNLEKIARFLGVRAGDLLNEENRAQAS